MRFLFAVGRASFELGEHERAHELYEAGAHRPTSLRPKPTTTRRSPSSSAASRPRRSSTSCGCASSTSARRWCPGRCRRRASSRRWNARKSARSTRAASVRGARPRVGGGAPGVRGHLRRHRSARPAPARRDRHARAPGPALRAHLRLPAQHRAPARVGHRAARGRSFVRLLERESPPRSSRAARGNARAASTSSTDGARSAGLRHATSPSVTAHGML